METLPKRFVQIYRKLKKKSIYQEKLQMQGSGYPEINRKKRIDPDIQKKSSGYTEN